MGDGRRPEQTPSDGSSSRAIGSAGRYGTNASPPQYPEAEEGAGPSNAASGSVVVPPYYQHGSNNALQAEQLQSTQPQQGAFAMGELTASLPYLQRADMTVGGSQYPAAGAFGPVSQQGAEVGRPAPDAGFQPGYIGSNPHHSFHHQLSGTPASIADGAQQSQASAQMHGSVYQAYGPAVATMPSNPFGFGDRFGPMAPGMQHGAATSAFGSIGDYRGGRSTYFPAGPSHLQTAYNSRPQWGAPGPTTTGYGIAGGPPHGQSFGPSRGTGSGSHLQIPPAPRGPPRKPKQSGYALWVGNLPPGARIEELKDHFSRDATRDIESVFLISKSNCAFVNYCSESACTAAMARFHDSKFRGVRLVCRLRRGPSAGNNVTVPGSSETETSPEAGRTAIEAIDRNREQSSRAEASRFEADGTSNTEDKYFVLKSLNLEDLELSAKIGVWATQSHNEAALNRAFKLVRNVYLIFSANKSGEYFGYARMASLIDDDSAARLEWEPPRQEPLDSDNYMPQTVPTPATATAPAGQIIDDSARGTVFWEAVVPDSDSKPSLPGPKPRQTSPVADGSGESITETKAPATDPSDGQFGDDPSPSMAQQTFGRPFAVEWLCTARLPFYRTRGLRNPWNANREVKIARDGTELETNVGRRLIDMFPGNSSAFPTSARANQPGGSGPGYPGPAGGFASESRIRY